MDRMGRGVEPSRAPGPEVAPTRSPFSRLSFGHMIMITAGLLAFLLNVFLLRSNEDTIQVLVAGNEISAGSRLVVADIDSIQVDADSPFAARVLNPETIDVFLGQIVTRDIAAGSPLLSDDLRPSAAPDAGRAMSIPISPSQAVAADIRRGDTVDVLSVVDGLAQYVAAGLEVLSVADPGDGRLANTSDFSVTVAVQDTTALSIATALDVGEVHLIRSTGAVAINVETGSTP